MRRLACAVALLSALVSCRTRLDDEPLLRAVEVTPPSAVVPAGLSTAFRATAIYDDGSGADITDVAGWASGDEAVATVAGGVASGVRRGSTDVTATFQGRSGSATLSVSEVTVVRVEVSPPTASLAMGAERRFTATAILSDLTAIDVTQVAAWSDAPTGIVDRIAPGDVRGLFAGSTTLTASYGGRSGAALITVTGARLAALEVTPAQATLTVGDTLPLRATARYSDGSSADVTASASWSSSASSVATVAADGRARGISAGSATISAGWNGLSGQAQLTVLAARPAALVVTPDQATLVVGGRVALRATARYPDGSSTDVTESALWSSGAASVAAVSNAPGARGQVMALAKGSTAVTATFDGLTGSAAITVGSGAVVALAIVPALVVAPAGTTVALRAIATLQDGSTVDVTEQALWTTADSKVAAVSNGAGSRGVVSALAPGSAKITATYGGRSAVATVTVPSVVLQSITLVPADPQLQVGEQRGVRAIARYSDGSTADVTEQAVWTTADPKIAVVSNSAGARGVVTGNAAGSTKLTATYGGLAGSTTVTVASKVKLVSLIVAPAKVASDEGESVQLSAIAVFSDGSSKDVTALAMWSSSNLNVATVGNGAQGGHAVGVHAGDAVITATYQGLSGQASYHVRM